ncbi:hypothetical protein AVEN_68383-1 [Araneus ventricosus]|uniref:Uncharacterized protein n=1 Tax=Araneus ventricosus TaxID=182803 RepID=A0A4Y2PP21_ARAVE|nr:hypothetical protein AVEN_68383-1 [Araneus ventricosus]
MTPSLNMPGRLRRMASRWPSDYFLFPKLKEQLSGTGFISDSDVKTAAEKWLSGKGHDFYQTGLKNLLLAMFYNIFDTVPERPVGNTDNLYFVLDGGSLIHCAVWPKKETFGDVYTTYMSYIKRHYGDEVTVVFDGYTESSVNTKVI